MACQKIKYRYLYGKLVNSNFKYNFSRKISSSTNTTKNNDQLDNAIKYCSNLVRKQDSENYLCSLFYPKHIQKVHWAIRAFNIELIMIGDSVSDPRIGKMRMQFWRETIDNIFKQNKPPQQPIAQVLHNSLDICNVSPLFFKRIIDARDALLDDPPFITSKDLESYAENTASCLLYLHLESLGIKDIQADHAASHIGKAIGIVTTLKAFPYLVSKRRMMLPAEITAKHNFSHEEIFRKGRVPGLNDAIFEIATIANDHLLTARTFLSNIPIESLPALLSAVSCNSYLKRLEKYDFDVFNPRLNIRDWKLPFQLWINYRRGEF
ncbi:14162_t:CDS:2 [Entrophospora sp. SA101]|nr:14162_t:CDS:2 [Entrophospora sp. SA101]CAJ0842126.1 3448_t:CDS:2 [Entrophospora sp. SA101]